MVKLFILALALFIGCARAPIKKASEAMRPSSTPFVLEADALSFTSLIEALQLHCDFLRNSKIEEFRFGPRLVKRAVYLQSLEYLLQVAKSDSTGRSFFEALRKNFTPFEVYGDKDWGQVFITSYFDAKIKGSRTKTAKYSVPLYGVPKDLVTVKLDLFSERFENLRPLRSLVHEQKSTLSVLRGRLVKNEPISQVVPYYSREEIDAGLSLKDQGVELAWVDPIDSFFVQIQGSCIVEFEDGDTMAVGYAAQNGHPYVPIGKHLFDVIPREKMSLQAIENHLRTLSDSERQKVLNLNPSYVFFARLKGRAQTFLGTEVVSGRTIATDRDFFPKGTLALLETEVPVFASADSQYPEKWAPAPRLVFDDDTGGAIRGPHRVDLYWGQGEEAKQAAGPFQRRGRLTYLVPNDDFLNSLK